MKVKTKREEVFFSVIEQLIKEKEKLEMRMALKGTGWILPEDHPRIGEVFAILPNYKPKN